MAEKFNPNNPGERRTSQPERHLVSACLERGIRDLLSNERNVFEEVHAWFFDSDEEEGETIAPFSFTWICEVLDIDKQTIRIKLQESLQAKESQANLHQAA